MAYKVSGVIKAIAFIFIVSALLTIGDISTAHARVFFVHTVSEIQTALDDAETNGESDLIMVGPGVYEINSVLRYRAMPSEENRMLLIGGLGSVFKPTFRLGEDGDDSGLLSLIQNHGGDLIVADIIFEGARKNGRGGALVMEMETGNIRLVNNRFIDNETVGSGGGAYLRNGSGNIDVFNNIFEGNRTPGGRGGGIQIISRPSYNPPFDADDVGEVRLYNNTFLNNEASQGGGIHINRRKHTLVLAYSNVFWENTGTPRDLYHELDDPHATYTDLCFLLLYNQINDFLVEPDDTCFDAYRNSALDPLLDGFVPRADSPVIDTGPDPDGPMLAFWIEPPPYDYRAKRRVVDGNGDGRAVIDRGAIEVDIPTSGGGLPPSPFQPLRVIPDVPESFGKLLSAPVKYLRISEVATNSDKRVGWTISPERSTSGTFALYYGDPVVGNYQTGKAANSGVIKLPPMKFEKGERPLLFFMLYMDTQRDRKLDTLLVYANNDLVWEKSPTNVRMGVWQPIGVDLKAYAGKTVKLVIKFDTINGYANHTEGVYIDDIVISRGGRIPAKYSEPHITKKAR